jgi:hypothetical protein
MGEVRNAYRILIVEYQRKRPHGRHRHSWRVMLKRALIVRIWTGFMWLMLGTWDGLL